MNFITLLLITLCSLPTVISCAVFMHNSTLHMSSGEERENKLLTKVQSLNGAFFCQGPQIH